MTSSATECFVYITLPGATVPVAAGRFVLDRDRRGDPIGRFVYGRSYLARTDAVALDPVELKLAERPYETVHLGGLFGALRDAGPDFWGRRLIEKHLGRQQLGELDYLLYAPDDRAGALGFGLNVMPPAPRRAFNQTLHLETLQTLADRLVADDIPIGSAAAQIENLLLLGTSMGGARPKTVVEDETGLWLAKFNTVGDRWNMARVEHAMLQLGRVCGLTTAESRVDVVGDRDVLLVKRFDRFPSAQGYARARMISALTLLRAGEAGRDRWSYVALAEELRRISAEPKRDAAELFRRMTFNALISNIDDHPRNHAFIAPQRNWALSPAYDLTPTGLISLERRDLAMTCGDLGRWANRGNLLSQAGRFLLSGEEAVSLVDTMTRTVEDRWFEVARRCGVSERDCVAIAGAFVYDGFRL